MHYTPLTQSERYQIYALRTHGLSGSEIAKELKRNKATISLELKRNAGARCWAPVNAHNIAQERQKNCPNSRLALEKMW
jgi:IS30 family transposase